MNFIKALVEMDKGGFCRWGGNKYFIENGVLMCTTKENPEDIVCAEKITFYLTYNPNGWELVVEEYTTFEAIELAFTSRMTFHDKDNPSYLLKLDYGGGLIIGGGGLYFPDLAITWVKKITT